MHISPRLQVDEPGGRRVVSLQSLPFSIGRRSQCDLHLPDTDVSRDHAEIIEIDGQLLLRDRGSRFGTFLNGVQIGEHPLSHGDKIAFGRGGRTSLVFLLDEAVSSVSASGFGGDLRQVAVLLEALRGMGGGRVLDEVLALVLDSAIDVTGAERGFIMLEGENGALDLKLARAAGKITLPLTGFSTSRKIPEEVFATGREKIVADLRDGDLMSAHEGTIALGIRHILCAPLRLVRYVERKDASDEARNIGVLYLDSRERGRILSGAARAALETLAMEAASAIENARLYRQALEKARTDQELRMAAHIQQALLPPPRREGAFFQVMGVSIPCRAIGGDFFEYLDLPTGAFGLALGDIAGKGPPAALLAAILQGMLAGQAHSSPLPRELMARINDGLLARGLDSRYATAFYGQLTPGGAFTYCNAGHNPPFVIGASGIRRLDVGGMIVGLFPEAVYEEETVQLAPGDDVLVFSDGVSEAESRDGEEFGDERIAAIARGLSAHTAADLVEAVLGAVREFTRGAAQNDDITAVVLKYTPAV